MFIKQHKTETPMLTTLLSSYYKSNLELINWCVLAEEKNQPVFLYGDSRLPTSLANTIQMGQATWAILGSNEVRYSLRHQFEKRRCSSTCIYLVLLS